MIIALMIMIIERRLNIISSVTKSTKCKTGLCVHNIVTKFAQRVVNCVMVCVVPIRNTRSIQSPINSRSWPESMAFHSKISLAPIDFKIWYKLENCPLDRFKYAIISKIADFNGISNCLPDNFNLGESRKSATSLRFVPTFITNIYSSPISVSYLQF